MSPMRSRSPIATFGSVRSEREFGAAVLLIFWKQHHLKRRDATECEGYERSITRLTPPEIVEDLIELIFTIETDGVKIDGVIVWGPENPTHGRQDRHPFPSRSFTRRPRSAVAA